MIIHTDLITVSVNKPPSVIAAWQALYRHSISPPLVFTHNGQWGNYLLLNGLNYLQQSFHLKITERKRERESNIFLLVSSPCHSLSHHRYLELS